MESDNNGNYLKEELYELIKTDKSIFDFIQGSIWEGVWYWDFEKPENRWMNARFWNLLGYKPEERPYKPSAWKNFIHQDDFNAANENFSKHCENPDHPFDQVVRYTHKKGYTVWIRSRGWAVRDSTGKHIRMLGSCQDISTHILSEQELQESKNRTEESEAKYRTLFESMDSGFVLFEVVQIKQGTPVDLLILAANKAFEQTTGLKVKEVIGRRLTRVLPGIDKDEANWIGRYSKVALTGESIRFEEDSELLGNYYSISAFQAGPKQCAVTFLDITDRKRSELKLADSEERLRLTTEQADIAVWEYDFNTNSMSRSRNHDKLYGLKWQTKWDINTFLNATHPEDREESNKFIQNAVTPGGPDDYQFDFRVVLPDETIRWLSVNGRVVERDQSGKGIRVRGTLADITEQKTTELALRESEARFRRAIISAPFPIMIHTEDGKVITLNTPWTRLTGYKKSDIPTIADWVSKAYGTHKDQVQSDIENLFDMDEPKAEGEYTITTSSGNKLTWDFSSAPIGELPDGRKLVISMAMDITKRKKAEERLKLLNRAVEASSVTVIITDADGNISYVNPYFTKITGYRFREVVGKNPRIFKSGNQTKAFYKDLWDTIKSGKDWTGDIQNMKKNGELFWEKVTISPIRSEGTGDITHFVAIKEDITELLKKEDELKQSLKEKEIMLAEVHHRVKNNLAVVSAMLQLQSFDEINHEVIDRLSASISRIKTIANIHESLYECESFSRVDFAKNIKTLAHGILDNYQVENMIKVVFTLEPIQLNINQAVPCSLIVNEVIVNAIKHAFTEEKKGDIFIQLTESNNRVQLKISDNGVGLPDNFMHKSDSSGNMIIKVLTEQIGGNFLYKRIKNGTEFLLKFDKNDIRGSSSTFI